MSLDDLKSLAAANPDLMSRLAAVQSLSELEAIATEVGISIDRSELDDEEMSSQELSAVTGGIGMLLSSKLGFGTLASVASTNDLNKCTTDTNDDTTTCKPVVVSTKKGESPSCG
jgi:hypothetical protein